MERIKRAVSLILCFVMVFGLLPMHAFAAEGETEPVNDITTQVEPMAETGSKTATGNLKGETTTVYTLTNTLTSGKQYLIVSRNSAGSGTALGSSTAGQTVTVENGNVITNKGNAVEWTATGSGNGWIFSNGSSYLGYTQNEGGSFLNGYTYTYELNPTGNNRTWTVNGSSLYINLQTSGRGIMGGSNTYADHYLVPGSTWSMSTSSSSANVYFYEKSESTADGVEVELTVNKGQVDLLVGKNETLTTSVKVGGTATTNYKLTWASSNPDVATVENGVITAHSDGDTKITATLTEANGTKVNGTVQVEIDVNVTAVTLTGISVSNEEGITGCVHKDADFSDVIVTATYSDGNTATITEDVTFTYENVVGEQTVTVTYEGKTATFPITVEEETAAGQLDGTTSFTFFQNTAEDFSRLSCVLTYPCGHSENVAADKLTISGYNISEIGTYENCPVSYNGTIVGSVTVNVVERTSTSVDGYLKGEKKYTLDTNGIDAGEKYLIVNSSGTRYALTNNSGVDRTSVTISNNTITVEDDSKIAWTFEASGNSYIISNNGVSIVPNNGSLSLSNKANGTPLTVSSAGNGAYRIYYTSGSYYYYVTYGSNWTGARTRTYNGTERISSVYLYREDGYGSGTGEKVTFTLNQSVTL